MSIIIGIDHGYYAIKTAHCSFPAGLTSYGEHEPYTRQGLLEFGGCFFVCGSGRQPIQRDKTVNDNYYLLTLAAIAKEIHLTMLIRIFIRSNIISGAIFKILSRSFSAEILVLQGFPVRLRDSCFFRDKSGKEIRRKAVQSRALFLGLLFLHLLRTTLPSCQTGRCSCGWRICRFRSDLRM